MPTFRIQYKYWGYSLGKRFKFRSARTYEAESVREAVSKFRDEFPYSRDYKIIKIWTLVEGLFDA